ncbi:MAG: hypothetical protein ACYDD4_01995 [Acidimicrobiales bacterium]
MHEEQSGGGASEASVSSLRGAAVTPVDARVLGRMVAALLVAALAVTAIVLFAAGAHSNAQNQALRTLGVPVTLTVRSCTGLLGGSGSNPVGYTCTGSYRLDRRQYTTTVPGYTPHNPGDHVAGVAVPDEPGLFTTSAALAGLHPSNGVYVVPSVLAAVALVGAGAIWWRRRPGHRRAPAGAPSAPGSPEAPGAQLLGV